MSDQPFKMDSIVSQWSIGVGNDNRFLVSRQADGSLKEWKTLPPLTTPLPERPKITRFGNVEFRQYRRRLQFFIGEQLVWDIEPRRFAGTPTLLVSSDASSIQLKDARFPGSLIPADLSLLIREVDGRWRMRLSFVWGGFQAEVDLEKWLSYQEVATSNLLLAGTLCNIGVDNITVLDNDSASFSPAWTFYLQGQTRFSGLETQLQHYRLFIALLPPQVLPFDKGTDGHLTLLSLGAGYESPWFDLPLHGTGQASWRTRAAAPVYSALQVTAWEPAPPRDGTVEPSFADSGWIVAAICQSEPAPRLELEAGGGLLGDNTGGWAIPLWRPGYFAVYHRDGRLMEHTLLATLGDEVQWLHSKYVSLHLGKPRYPLFSLSWNDTLTRCGHPALLLNKEYGLRYRLQASVVRVDGLEAEPACYPDPPPALVSLPPKMAVVALGSHEPKLTDQDVAMVRLTGADPARIVFPTEWRAKFQRHQDLLVLQFHFSHIRLVAQGDALPRLERPPLLSGKQPVVVVKFPPQSIAEPCSQDDCEQGNTPNDLPPSPTRFVAAGSSRLAWQLNRDCALDTQLLLGWFADPKIRGLMLVNLSPRLAATAISPPTTAIPLPDPHRPRPRPIPAIQEPAAHETAIEAPVRLFLSPDQQGVWEGSRTPVAQANQTELWHVRLRDKAGHTPIVRAIWAKDCQGGGLPFTCNALSSRDRKDIVGKSVRNRAVSSHHLMLSSLGAWLDLLGEWPEDPQQPCPEDAVGTDHPCGEGDSNLELWRHVATLGRDHFVKIVRRGYLLPFGHKAVYVKVTERKFITNAAGYREARLLQRHFITVREKERCFKLSPLPAPGIPPVADRAEQLRRCFPFTRLEILVAETPCLKKPESPESEDLFWPAVIGDGDYLFPIRATDRTGQTVEFNAPLQFVASCSNTINLSSIIGTFNKGAESVRNTYQLWNQRVVFAAAPSGQENQDPCIVLASDKVPALEVTDLRVAAVLARDMPIPGDTDAKRPFNPSMAYLDDAGKLAFTPAKVLLPVLRQLGGVNTPQWFQYAAAYAKEGLVGGNQGEVFFQAVTPFDLAFGGNNRPDKIGALATPSMKVGGISSKIGAFGVNEANVSKALDSISAGRFDPSHYFSEALEAKILGGITLKNIVESAGATLDSAPQWVSSQENGNMVYSLSWQTKLVSNKDFLADTAGCSLKLTIKNRLKAGEVGSSQISAELTNFSISFANAIKIQFIRFAYTATAGTKPLIHLELPSTGAITFMGGLSFINKLNDYLKPEQFSDPPFINVSSDGITAGYSLPIPTVAVGAFALQNLALSAAITLPFTGDPMEARFALSERHAPFMVTVSLFAGEGFVALVVGSEGVKMVEVSLGFGASIQLNLGVASGGVSVIGGIYICYSETKTVLSGFVRINGAMELLGLVCVSVNYQLSLTHESKDGRNVAWGEASATFKVEIAFFSKSVTVSVRREFASGSEDLRLEALMSPSDWSSYWQAFNRGL